MLRSVARPKSDNPHDQVVSVRYTADEIAAVRAAAERKQVTIGQYIRDRSVRAARRAK